MASRQEKRKDGYKYMVAQLKKLDWDIECQTDKNIQDIDFLSLAEIEELRKGYADPSDGLVAGLKKLLHHVASEDEIDAYLVDPFLPTPEPRK
jgi:hypothetical protein